MSFTPLNKERNPRTLRCACGTDTCPRHHYHNTCPDCGTLFADERSGDAHRPVWECEGDCNDPDTIRITNHDGSHFHDPGCQDTTTWDTDKYGARRAPKKRKK